MSYLNLTCGGHQSATPVGGDGASSRCSQIFIAPPNCSLGITLDGNYPGGTGTPLQPTANMSLWFNEQVTRIELRPAVSTREYGHDKSFCCQDSTPGTRSWNGSIQSRIQCCTAPFSIYAGALAWLSIYPLSFAADPLVTFQGWALIKEDPINMNLENGDPTEHNYTYVSKGRWQIPAGVSGFYDCCECCKNIGGSYAAEHFDRMDSSIHVEAARLGGIVHNPVTVYEWKNGQYVIALDESADNPGYMPGPMPKEPPKENESNMKYIRCILAM